MNYIPKGVTGCGLIIYIALKTGDGGPWLVPVMSEKVHQSHPAFEV